MMDMALGDAGVGVDLLQNLHKNDVKQD